MKNKLIKILALFNKSNLLKNSSWGIFAHLIQTLCISLLFIIIVRQYSVQEFSNYIISTVLYQLLVALSTLGLSQWFIREMVHTDDKKGLATEFFKMQLCFGILFYAINILLAFLLYQEDLIRLLSIVIGANIIIDNLINAIKSLNIVEFNQNKTFKIVALDSLLKLLTGSILLYYPFSIIVFSFFLLIIRIFTLNLFLKFGSSSLITIKSILKHKIYFVQIKKQVKLNWAFIIIGGVSIINWRISHIVISKVLTEVDVANYEISYKIFSIAQIFPVIISSTVYPMLINLLSNEKEFRTFYRKAHSYYSLFGLLSFSFIATFSGMIIPLLFGATYVETSKYTTQMFFTMLIFPTVFLQANVLVAMKLEKMDMWLNVIALFINISACLIGLVFFKTLEVINFSIFFSFLIFHLLQDILLITRKVASVKQVVVFYIINISVVSCYILLPEFFNFKGLFFALWASIIFIIIILNYYNNKRQALALGISNN